MNLRSKKPLLTIFNLPLFIKDIKGQINLEKSTNEDFDYIYANLIIRDSKGAKLEGESFTRPPEIGSFRLFSFLKEALKTKINLYNKIESKLNFPAWIYLDDNSYGYTDLIPFPLLALTKSEYRERVSLFLEPSRINRIMNYNVIPYSNHLSKRRYFTFLNDEFILFNQIKNYRPLVT